MPSNGEHRPGEPAPVSGTYRLLNVFGTPTARLAVVARGEPLPGAPIGHAWKVVETEREE